MKKSLLGGLILSLCTTPAFALNILLVNDDGLTSNIKALYDELKANGHNVLVSVPCSPQSGRGGAIVMYSSTTINADNDKQIALKMVVTMAQHQLAHLPLELYQSGLYQWRLELHAWHTSHGNSLWTRRGCTKTLG